MASTDVTQLWQQISQLLTRENVTPSVWEAARAAIPITVDGATLVLGFKPTEMRFASYLQTNVTASIIRRLGKQITGQDMELRCIEGTGVEAWERVRAREAAALERMTSTARVQVDRRPGERVWADLGHKLNGLFREARSRTTPLIAARLIREGVELVAEALRASRQAAPDQGEVHERELNRALDRLGDLAGIPGTVVALEYLRVTGHTDEGEAQG